MRLVFAGTPEFARVALVALKQAGHEILAVLTQPDRPSGRGMKLQASAVKQAALELDLSVWQPDSLRDAEIQARLAALAMDAMVVAAYGQILPQAVLDLPRLGCYNIHASLLPRWRGAAPIHRAIAAGDLQTGISIMQMDAGLDTGSICRMSGIPILADDTTGSLHDRLAELGGRLMVDALADAATGRLTCTPQPAEGITYASKISRAEAQLDWRLPATVLQRKIRAFNPAPGAFCLWQDQPLKCWQADVLPLSGPPGRVLRSNPDGLVVACAEGALALRQIQPAGGRRLNVEQFLAGHALPEGTMLA